MTRSWQARFLLCASQPAHSKHDTLVMADVSVGLVWVDTFLHTTERADGPSSRTLPLCWVMLFAAAYCRRCGVVYFHMHVVSFTIIDIPGYAFAVFGSMRLHAAIRVLLCLVWFLTFACNGVAVGLCRLCHKQ